MFRSSVSSNARSRSERVGAAVSPASAGRLGGRFRWVAQALGRVAAAFVPSDAGDAEFRLGVDLQQQADFGGAIECYERAIAIDPNYAAAYSNLGVVKQHVGRLTEAISASETGPN